MLYSINCVAQNAYSQSNKRILGSAIFSNLMDGSLGNPRKEKKSRLPVDMDVTRLTEAFPNVLRFLKGTIETA